jgi:DNA mismatch repair protein MutL
MGTIKKLSSQLIEKIAAGEVIERPVSIVKECIENSIDAGATMIKIELIAGGKEEVRISDNGSGMPKEDLEIAAERHTTSKLKELKDLFNIRRLGFRGEALASIRAISNLAIISNAAGEAYRLEDGRLEACAAPKGTTVIARNLFYNTPARKKFLGSEVTELRLILDFLTRFALANHEIGFSISNNGQQLMVLPATLDLLGKVTHIYGKEVARNMVKLEHKGRVYVHGLIGVPSMTRKTRSYMSFFVNRRIVKSKLLVDAVESAYKTLLFLDRKPIAVVNVEVDPVRLDVNVHPTKLEVKFDDEDLIFTEVHLAVKKALEGNVLIKKQEQSLLLNLLRTQDKKPAGRAIEPTSQSMLVRDSKSRDYRVLGQYSQSFILVEAEDGLLIVDQHAAAERIALEKLNKSLTLPNNSQTLLQPILVSPPKPFASHIRSNLGFLKQLGFDVEEFGQQEFLVREVPVVFRQAITKEFLNDLFDELGSRIKKTRRELVDDEIIYALACKSSIRANDELSMSEIYELLDELFRCSQSYACAHGRPTIIKFTLNDLEKLFRRK